MAFTATPGSFTPINMFAMLRNLINQDTPIVTNAGAPTNGTSGTYANLAGPGALLIDNTNGNLYINTNTKASPTWTLLYSAIALVPITALAVDGAISTTISRVYAITKGSAIALTIAAPAASPGGDGAEITVTSDTAFAHIITFTGNKLDSGGTGVLTATFNANKGASITFISYNARWKVLSANGVGLS